MAALVTNLSPALPQYGPRPGTPEWDAALAQLRGIQSSIQRGPLTVAQQAENASNLVQTNAQGRIDYDASIAKKQKEAADVDGYAWLRDMTPEQRATYDQQQQQQNFRQGDINLGVQQLAPSASQSVGLPNYQAPTTQPVSPVAPPVSNPPVPGAAPVSVMAKAVNPAGQSPFTKPYKKDVGYFGLPQYT